MATKADLEEKIAIIDQAPACPKHGRDALKICMEPIFSTSRVPVMAMGTAGTPALMAIYAAPSRKS